MLRACFDRSELYEPAGVVVVAGLLSSTDRWERFEANWREVLDSFGIKSFHMADFENRQGFFADWPDERRIGCISQLNNTINAAAMMGLSVMVSTAEYQVLGAVKRGDLDPFPFALCAAWAIVQSLKYVRDIAKVESPLACVFHGGDEGSPDVLRLVQAHRKRLPDFDTQLHSLSFEKATGMAGLQAADLFAYETAKATLRVFTKADLRPSRKSFVHLLNREAK